ncbi:hypothetical protein OSTOST_05786, partial [Ostertagia ostertagi]
DCSKHARRRRYLSTDKLGFNSNHGDEVQISLLVRNEAMPANVNGVHIAAIDAIHVYSWASGRRRMAQTDVGDNKDQQVATLEEAESGHRSSVATNDWEGILLRHTNQLHLSFIHRLVNTARAICGAIEDFSRTSETSSVEC